MMTDSDREKLTEVIQLLLNAGWKVDKIAKYINLSDTTIRKYIRKYDLHSPSKPRYMI